MCLCPSNYFTIWLIYHQNTCPSKAVLCPLYTTLWHLFTRGVQGAACKSLVEYLQKERWKYKSKWKREQECKNQERRKRMYVAREVGILIPLVLKGKFANLTLSMSPRCSDCPSPHRNCPDCPSAGGAPAHPCSGLSQPLLPPYPLVSSPGC